MYISCSNCKQIYNPDDLFAKQIHYRLGCMVHIIIKTLKMDLQVKLYNLPLGKVVAPTVNMDQREMTPSYISLII